VIPAALPEEAAMKFTLVRCTLIALILVVLVTGTSSGQNPVQDQKTKNDLRQLVLAYHNYHDTFAKAPEKPDDLGPFIENDKRLLEAMKSGQLMFLFGVKITEMTDGTSNTVLIYEKDAPTKGGFVAYGDGTVKKLSADEFKKAILAKKK
jgi:hypothetical protein